MMIPAYNQEGKKVKDIRLPKNLGEKKVSPDLIHQAIVTELANKRPSLAHTKDRSEVRGGGRKPWRQKGTGRARHGSIRSPLWKGGGITFGPRKEKKYTKRLPKKMKKIALLGILQAKIKDKKVIVVEDIVLKEPKTRHALQLIDNLVKNFQDFKIAKNSLLILTSKINQKNKNLKLAFRNIPQVEVRNADSVSPLTLARFQYIILTQEAFNTLQARLEKINQ